LSAYLEIANGLASGVLTLGVGGAWATARAKWARGFSRGTPEEQAVAVDLLDQQISQLNQYESAMAAGVVDFELDNALVTWEDRSTLVLGQHLDGFLERHPEAIPDVQDLTRSLRQQADQSHTGSGHNIANVEGGLTINYHGGAAS